MNKKRAIYLLIVFGIIFLTLIGYLTYLEIFYADEYTSSVYNPRNYELDRKVIRGSVFDRSGIEIAYSEKITEEKSEIVNGTQNIWYEDKIVRKYPFDQLYSHVVGYVTADYSSRTLIENKYNSELLESDILNNIIDEVKYGEKRGKDITLTIDHELQKCAYEAMGNYDGALIAMNPKTGEILAMVSKPDFNPNPGKLDLDNLKDTALFSRAIQMPYPPGSTYKIVTSAAVIENGLEEEIYSDTTGKYVINDYSCQNVNKVPYGNTNLESGFRVSSNVYFSHMGVELGTQTIQNIAERFIINKNINSQLGFDLPIESGRFQNGEMTKAERAMASIGQGQTELTPIHIALIGATIANDGVMPRPYLVSKVGIENQIPENNPGKQVIDSSTAQKIKDMMLSVVESGTGTTARINGIKVCGKTGTSENSLTANGGKDSKKTHALFVGFAPYEDPEIVVCAVMEYAGFGSSVAAPASRKVMEKYFFQK